MCAFFFFFFFFFFKGKKKKVQWPLHCPIFSIWSTSMKMVRKRWASNPVFYRCQHRSYSKHHKFNTPTTNSGAEVLQECHGDRTCMCHHTSIPIVNKRNSNPINISKRTWLSMCLVHQYKLRNFIYCLLLKESQLNFTIHNFNSN